VTRLLTAAVLSVWLLGAASAFAHDEPPPMSEAVKKGIDGAKQAGNIAWMLMATGLVMVMMPGLALFYGGMVRRKNVLGTMMHTMVALGIVGVQWVVCGYSLAFGDSYKGLVGWKSDLLFLNPMVAGQTFPNTDCPVYLHAMFQGMFAIITVALISGAFAERVRFGPYCLFVLLWTTLVYDPLAHWVWSIEWTKSDPAASSNAAAGWLGAMGALDFAGGTVVHVAAGAAGLAAILLLRKRHGYPEHAFHPNSMVLTLLGAGLLWFGWFGFNGGSAVASTVQAASALTVTQIAAATAGLAWVLVEWAHRGKPTALGFASGVVAGLVGITPASGFVAPVGALAIGVAAGVLCYLAVCLKPKLKYDDSLDAFGIHGVGGFIGAILTGVFAHAVLWKTGTGLTDADFPGPLVKDGRLAQIWVQVVAAVVAAAFSFVATAVLVVLIDKTIGFTLDAKSESDGVDRAIHGETGFDYGGTGLEELPAGPPAREPKPALVPPNGKNGHTKRFTVVVEGPEEKELRNAWSGLCQTGNGPPTQEFRSVYPYVTTVTGNKFRFRGGDPVVMRLNLEKLFQDTLGGTAVKAHVES
jgi:ammonium transporter